MKKKEAIITFLVIGLVLIGGITFCAIFNGQQNEPPVVTTAETPVSTLDETATTKNEGISEVTTTKSDDDINKMVGIM